MNVSYKQQKGVSLMELLIAIGIFLFVVAIVWLFISQTYSVQSFTFGQTIAIDEARRGVSRMVKEAREALPSDSGSYAIESANDFEFVFYADYDRDNAVERVRYFLEGSNFIKGVTEASGQPLEYVSDNEEEYIISRYVRNAVDEPIFKYYDGSYSGKPSDVPLSAPANPLEVKLVHIYLKINVDPDKAPRDFELESDVQIRNLKENL